MQLSKILNLWNANYHEKCVDRINEFYLFNLMNPPVGRFALITLPLNYSFLFINFYTVLGNFEFRFLHIEERIT